MKFLLEDYDKPLEEGEDMPKLNGKVTQTEVGQILIAVDGYGDCCSNDGEGHVAAMELFEGKLRLIVWGDIMKEDPTHVIDLNGSLERLRDDG
jgi:hypothetical protein